MTSFQEEVYKVVRKIPKGRIMSYKSVAKKAGRPLSWRAVGNILNRHQEPGLPCHRVIRSNGKIGGYRRGVRKKTLLLKKEGIIIKNDRVCS